MPRPKATARPHGRIILLSSPKGGTGKSSLARNILVSAAKSELRVLGIDFDPQETLHKWFLRRERVRESFPDCLQVEVSVASIGDWRNALKTTGEFDLVVLDTPPSIEVHYNAAMSLCSAADLVVVPCGATQDDVDASTPWMATLTQAGEPAAFVLNKTNRRTKSYETASTKLLQGGPLCPVEIRVLEDIHVSAGKGLAVMDFAKAKASDTFDALWSYILREARL